MQSSVIDDESPVCTDRQSKRHSNHEERSPLLADRQSPDLSMLTYDNVTVINPSGSRSYGSGRYKFTGCWAAVFLTVNACIGAGILNVSQVFDKSGSLLISFIIESILLVFITGSLFILSYCVDLSGVDNFQNVVKYFCGDFWAKVCSYFIVLHAYGVCLTFLVIIGDQSDRLLTSLYGSDFCHYWYMNRNFTIPIIATALVLPLCFSKYIDFLKYPSSGGLAVIIYILFLIVHEYSEHHVPDAHINTLLPENWSSISIVVPVICFAYQCHLSWVPTYARMQQNFSSTKLWITIIGSILICVISYSWAIVFGILTFGSGKLDTDLMKNYDPNEKVVLIGILCLIFKTVTTYPLLLFCARIAIDKWIQNLTRDLVPEPKRRALIVLIWFMSTLVISTTLPDIGLIIDLVGTLAVTFIFIFPGMCLKGTLKIAKDPRKRLKNTFINIVAMIYVLLGVFVFILSLIQWINNDFIKERDRDPPLCT
ncbi:sodium-coupled neutral amino acid transporter 7-like isoform X2 [Brevipalpus obovatus]|uniref:sodium-coupled neutral amino acid transporter 7-like isoform X2 n=1 Tax=Brevipalpus obovatus TaxID=246614 RepID=UPI003D9EC613